MRLREIYRCACVWLACWGVSDAHASAVYDRAIVETASTSIYVGKVTLHVTPFVRQNGGYVADYRARVFPYFFMNEHGTLRIEISDADLARVARGETVEFAGRAETSGGEPRQVTGRAVPNDATSGALKVRVFVSKKIQLVFNTTYRFVH